MLRRLRMSTPEFGTKNLRIRVKSAPQSEGHQELRGRSPFTLSPAKGSMSPPITIRTSVELAECDDRRPLVTERGPPIDRERFPPPI